MISFLLHLHYTFDAELKIFHNNPGIKLNIFAFILFTLFETQIQGYRSLIVLQLSPHLLALAVLSSAK